MTWDRLDGSIEIMEEESKGRRRPSRPVFFLAQQKGQPNSTKAPSTGKVGISW